MNRVCAPHFIADFRAFARKWMQSFLFSDIFIDFCAKINENQREKGSRAHPDEGSGAATDYNEIEYFLYGQNIDFIFVVINVYASLLKITDELQTSCL